MAGGAFTGGVGPQRSIFFDEALGIIIRIHNELRIDLGSRSSREFRVDFLFAAVAAIHYGHPRFNPAGPDPSWCVKDAGAGRPPSDDVLVLCQSRDAWDLIGGAGANGYFLAPHDTRGAAGRPERLPAAGQLAELPQPLRPATARHPHGRRLRPSPVFTYSRTRRG